MSKQKFYCWLFFLLPVVYYLSLPIATGDLAVWVAQGKHFLSHGQILRHDIYSVLPTRDLVYPWGTCVLYALFYSIGGLLAVSLFHKLIVITISFFWYRSLMKLRGPWASPSLLVIFLAWLGCSLFWIDRPALVGMLPFVYSFILLEKDEDLSLADLLKLVLINIVWVNLHGSWPILLCMYLWREGVRLFLWKKVNLWQQIVTVFALAVSAMINPFGSKVFNYILETAKLSKERHIDEWATPSVFGPYGSQSVVYFLLVILSLLYFYFLYQNSRNDFKRMITSPYLPILLCSAGTVRNTALPFFILIPFACEYILIKGKSEEEGRISIINIFIVGFVCVLGFLFLPMVKPYSEGLLPENKKAVYDSSAPILDTDYLNSTSDSEAVFNDWEYGSFLILKQKHPIFIDTRNIIYGKNEFDEYARVISANEGWDTILEKYKIRYVLLNRKQRSNLIAKINASLKWKSVVVDEETILFQKKI